MAKKLTLEDITGNNKLFDFNAEKEFESSIIDLNSKVERPPLCASIGYDDVSYKGHFYPLKLFSFGNISTITGEEKSRKSFVKSLFEACIIGGKANEFDNDLIKGYVPQDKYIISIDTEQSDYDAWLNGKRVIEMVGNKPDNYIVIKLREKSKAERLEILEWLFMESEYRNKIGLAMLDGYVDFIKDFNSLEESGEFSDKLLKYSSMTQSHISGILHLNPNSEKLRGHAGTILAQKSEMVILVKNEGEYSTIKCQRIRGGKPFKTFTIRINENWLPYISNDEVDGINKNLS